MSDRRRAVVSLFKSWRVFGFSMGGRRVVAIVAGNLGPKSPDPKWQRLVGEAGEQIGYRHFGHFAAGLLGRAAEVGRDR